MSHDDLWHRSAPPVELYHYCSTETLVAIITGGSIRLSSLAMSNDSEEGRLMFRLIDRLGEKHRVPPAVLTPLKEHWNEVMASNEALGFCLSYEPDLLSQWRGYASQGRGVCIGFSSDYLTSLSDQGAWGSWDHATLEEVVYNESHQMKAFEPTFHLLIQTLLRDAEFSEDRPPELGNLLKATLTVSASEWVKKIYTFKGSGFAEEREWRMLTMLANDGVAHCEYRVADEKIVAFRPYALSQHLGPDITSVRLGPKHGTPVAQMEQFLKRYKINATVERSSLSYR